MGGGSFGQVYRAVHKSTKEERAIKIIAKKKIEKTKNKEEFKMEVELLRNMVSCYYLFNFVRNT